MPVINNFPAGGIMNLTTVTSIFLENGAYSIIPEGYDGFDKVDIQVSVADSTHQPISATNADVLENKTFYTTNTSGNIIQSIGTMPTNVVNITTLTPNINSVTISSGHYASTAAISVNNIAISTNPSTTTRTLAATTAFFNQITVNAIATTSTTVTPSISTQTINGPNNVKITVKSAPLSSITASTDANGAYTFTVPSNYYGFTTATLNVNVSGATPTYTVTNMSAADAIINKTFYQATTTSSVMLTTGAGFLDNRTIGRIIGYDVGEVICGTTYVTIRPDWDRVIGGVSDPNAPDPDYYPHSGGGVQVHSNWLAYQMGLINDPSETTSSIIMEGYTILGITGTGSSGGTDLTGTTWQIKNSYTELDCPWSSTTYGLSFNSNGNSYTSLTFDYYSIFYDTTEVFKISGGPPVWVNSNYRTIYITGGAAATDANLINWLQSYATQIS